jgi:hypothetical protein
MAASTAAKNRKLRQDTLREYITERGSIQYLFDLIEKIEGLDPDSSTFTNDLQKYKAALDARIKMAGKYLPDLKSQEVTGEGGDALIVSVLKKRFDGVE